MSYSGENKTFRAVARIAGADTERLDKIMCSQAFENCDYQSKCYEKCSETGECDQRGIISYFWKKMGRLN